MRLLSRNTELVKLIMERVIKENDLCIDATLGNGNDASYMYRLGAKVIGFDIQDKALDNSKIKIEEEIRKKLVNKNQHVKESDIEKEYVNKVTLIKDSHENIEKYLLKIKEEYETNEIIKFATFNLGYLPKGKESIITKADSTIKAIDTCIKYLSKDGVISIIVYYEHEGGLEEKEGVEKYLNSLNEEKLEVVCLNKCNTNKYLPITYYIYKK